MIPSAEDLIPGHYSFRRAGACDVAGISALYRSLSPASRQLRFFSVPCEELDSAAHRVQDGSAVAVVASYNGEVVGEARYEANQRGNMDFGVVVADEHHSRGVGQELLLALRREALAQGVTSLHAVVQLSNGRMWQLLTRVGFVLTDSPESGQVAVEIACDGWMPGWGEDALGKRVLVEDQASWPSAATAQLREAGFEVRQCIGPSQAHGRRCPLLTEGRCRLYEQADAVACLLPGAEPECQKVIALHAERGGGRACAVTMEQFCELTLALLGPVAPTR